MSILFIDCEFGSEEIEGEWEIKAGCLEYYSTDGETIQRNIVPLHNIIKMTEYDNSESDDSESDDYETDSRSWEDK